MASDASRSRRKPRRAAQLGVTDAEYARLLEAQGGGCAICGAKPKTRRLHADHDHRTGKVRGLLCHRCNRALPNWITPGWLRDAARYLDPPREPNPHIDYIRSGWRPVPVDPARLAK